MKQIGFFAGIMLATASLWAMEGGSADTNRLRLVPFPKEVSLAEGSFSLSRPLTLHVPDDLADVCVSVLSNELVRAGLPLPAVSAEKCADHHLALSSAPGLSAGRLLFREQASAEDYLLEITREQILCSATDPAGVLHAVQTLCQLIRANRKDSAIPCLSIRDWPSLKWRGFQNDMTRGPSAKLETLKGQIALSSYLKMNYFSYYMEYQFAYSKHPDIGPADGSFTPDELKALVAYAKTFQINILGNQQSFGHLTGILKLEKYGHLAEYSDHNIHPNNRWSLSPALEESYQLLDDLYSDQIPLLPFGMFNVDCDEVGGLGTGPAKEMVEKFGAAEVYVRHMLRIHTLLKQKYKQRMMMWGDIILHHPDKLGKIPKDTVMMTWDYEAKPDFSDKITPFSQSGYEFFVCPGVSGWGRVLPAFETATVNIRNFVRDGIKQGALGMLNTDWKDDCQSLNATIWHGAAWGAECAWSGSATSPEDFNRRIGAVLFGESGDHFGRAIEGLSKVEKISGISEGSGIMNRRFWENDFQPKRGVEATRASAGELLDAVRPALEQLEACRQEASFNTELLDGFIFGARRMVFLGERMLDGAEAYAIYNQAFDSEPAQAAAVLEKIKGLLRKHKAVLELFEKQYVVLWNREVKPYALDRVTECYAQAYRQYDALLSRLDGESKRVADKKPLAPPAKIGLGPDTLSRRTWADQEDARALAPEAPWAEPTASHRLGLSINAGKTARYELPVELDVSVPLELQAKPVRAFCTTQGAEPREIPAQLEPSSVSARARLTLLLPGPLPANSDTAVYVYLGLPAQPPALPQAVLTSEAPQGMKWLENDQIRLLLGPEGGHLYRWEAKALNNRDFTHPGERDWAGFLDLGGKMRGATNQLVCLASGPALVRYRCVDPSGVSKQLSLYAGASWVEVTFAGVKAHSNYDNADNFAADGPTPGKYLFSTGQNGSVGKLVDNRAAQVMVPGAFWCIKYNDLKMALGLVTPEQACHHELGPGGGWGGVGSVGGADHSVIYAGLLTAAPEAAMNHLQQTLNLRNQPGIALYALEQRTRE